ncbi:hypothetical protein [Mycobacterium palustre]|uniref:Minor tail protein n=1 Tax=Mycobacterium palustre TaxID=153971 RepID=A0A1X1ZL22_9MYCO|nr:hypothetical protein [Mycobacterium palustre]MCV7100971.1 hypothetical protein [Mycobacterium palustre]ORW24012.1 hypothetical protein AWC19_00195 [Mycobacterium palustre]
MTSAELAVWNHDLHYGSLTQRADAATKLADSSDLTPEFVHTLYDNLWRPIREFGPYLIDSSGTQPRNAVPSETLKAKGGFPGVRALMDCRKTLVGVTVETEGQRFAFYVDTHEYEFEKDSWTSTSNCLGIWDIFNYAIIWADWLLPIQAQIFSHAIFIGPLVTVIENMISECFLRIQSGINEFLNNALSLNPDIRAWFYSLQHDNPNIFEALKTPVYVVRTNPFLDGSPIFAKTVRFEPLGKVIMDITRPYGVDVGVDLWLPGDAQPDQWANLDRPTYVVTVRDRSQVTGPFKNVLDSVVREVVDLEGSFFGSQLAGLVQQAAVQGVYISPAQGVNFVQPYAIMIAPEEGEKTSILSCKIVDHTPKGWRTIIGGKSPKWLNDLINAFFSWLVDSVMIFIGITGVPSDLLAGFLNDAFFAFQLIDWYDKRAAMGPYHPGMEVFVPTGASPYNVEAIFTFLEAAWDGRGYTAAVVKFRNGSQYALGRDVFRGGLMSLVYLGRTRMYTDYVDLVAWHINDKEREITAQIGDGRSLEAPQAKHQRLITGLQEAFQVATLAPNQ